MKILRSGKRFQFVQREFPELPDLQTFDADGSDRDAGKFEDFAPNGLNHTADLPVAAFGDGDFEEAVLFRITQTIDDCGARGPVGEFDAFAQGFELLFGYKGAAFDLIGFGDLVIGVRQTLGELRVVGEDDEAGGFEVEAADG